MSDTPGTSLLTQVPVSEAQQALLDKQQQPSMEQENPESPGSEVLFVEDEVPLLPEQPPDTQKHRQTRTPQPTATPPPPPEDTVKKAKCSSKAADPGQVKSSSHSKVGKAAPLLKFTEEQLAVHVQREIQKAVHDATAALQQQTAELVASLEAANDCRTAEDAARAAFQETERRECESQLASLMASRDTALRQVSDLEASQHDAAECEGRWRAAATRTAADVAHNAFVAAHSVPPDTRLAPNAAEPDNPTLPAAPQSRHASLSRRPLPFLRRHLRLRPRTWSSRATPRRFSLSHRPRLPHRLFTTHCRYRKVLVRLLTLICALLQAKLSRNRTVFHSMCAIVSVMASMLSLSRFFWLMVMSMLHINSN